MALLLQLRNGANMRVGEETRCDIDVTRREYEENVFQTYTVPQPQNPVPLAGAFPTLTPGKPYGHGTSAVTRASSTAGRPSLGCCYLLKQNRPQR